MRPAREDHRAFGRTVRQILSAGEVGVRWPDNVGPTVEFVYNSDKTPISVTTGLAREPAWVVVRRARLRSGSGGTARSGDPIEWTFRAGSIEVASIGNLTASTDYDVVLGLEPSNGE